MLGNQRARQAPRGRRIAGRAVARVGPREFGSLVAHGQIGEGVHQTDGRRVVEYLLARGSPPGRQQLGHGSARLEVVSHMRQHRAVEGRAKFAADLGL